MSRRATRRSATRQSAIRRGTALLALVVAAALALVGGLATGRAFDDGSTAAQTAFPHDRHARLFPTCEGCHAGIATGDRATSFPDSAGCAECHSGITERGAQRAVAWREPSARPSNLRFSHVAHAREQGAPAATECASCHQAQGGGWMRVTRGQAATCVSCHGHEAPAHLAPEAPCASCHVPLTRATALPVERVARFPKPPGHEARDFVSAHGAQARRSLASCATCHAQESCATCHPNAGTLASVQALGRDARVASLVAGKPARYALPASHRRGSFAREHGPEARAAIAQCANCHAQPSCQACHLGGDPAGTIAKLPTGRGTAPGVRLVGEDGRWSGARLTREGGTAAADAADARGGRGDRHDAPASRPPGAHEAPRDASNSAARDRAEWDAARGVTSGATGATTAPGVGAADADVIADPRAVRVHAPNFERTHGAQASSGEMNCQSCHGQRFCADCHEGENRRRYHQPNFTQRHAAESYGRERDCAQCHQTEVFCRQCHQQSGMATDGRRGVAFHNAQPLWLLQHGRAARQSLQSCTSCHAQRDCQQCHAQTGQGVNPHGRNFDAQRAASRNRLTCLRCHVQDPLRGR